MPDPIAQPSNKIPLLILAAALVVLLILLGVYHFWNRRAAEDNATTTARVYRPLTEAEREATVAQNLAVMMQFATTTEISPAEFKKEEKQNTEVMKLFAPAAPAVSTKEGKQNYNLMKLFQN